MPKFTPVNQVRLTNVAIVRYKNKGKRFEIACYPNKVTDWRNKIEKDLDEVVQTTTIFKNVSKADAASSKDMKHVFGTDDEKEVCLEILKKGNLQVTSKERQATSENVTRDIATIVADKCVDSDTGRPFTVSMITESMKEIHFSVNPKRTAKQQALEVIQKLKEDTLPSLERAQMRILCEVPKNNGKELKVMLDAHKCAIEDENWGMTYTAEILLDPGAYRSVTEKLQQISKGNGTFEILDMQVQEEGNVEL